MLLRIDRKINDLCPNCSERKVDLTLWDRTNGIYHGHCQACGQEVDAHYRVKGDYYTVVKAQ